MVDVSEKHRAVAEKFTNDFRMVLDGCEGDLMEIIAAALANAEREGMKRGYLAGFNASGEVWNAEYPFQDQGRMPEGSPEWVKDLDSFLSEAVTD